MATYQHPTGGKRKTTPITSDPRFSTVTPRAKDQKDRLLWAKKNPDRPTIIVNGLDGLPRKIKNPYYTGAHTPAPAAPAAPAANPAATVEPAAPATPSVDTTLPDYDDSGFSSALGSSQSDFGGGPDLSGVFKPPAALNVNQLMGPAVRLLGRQKADAAAARDKASLDLNAFNDYLARSQASTQQGLGHQLTNIAGEVAANRTASLGNVAKLTQGAVAAAGGNTDLLKAGGMTSALQGQSLLQDGQTNANEALAATQTGLATRQADQNRTSNALAAGLPLELARQYNAAQSELGGRESDLIDKSADLRASDVESQRKYASDQAAQSIAAWTAQQEYGAKDKDRAVKVLTARESERTKRLIASINNKVKQEIEAGKLNSRDADRRARTLEGKLNRASREDIEAYRQEAMNIRSGPGGADLSVDLDKLAESHSLDPADMLAYGSARGMDMQRNAAIKFVNSARNRYGRGAVPWSQMNALLETHFPSVSEDPQLGKQLKAIWVG